MVEDNWPRIWWALLLALFLSAILSIVFVAVARADHNVLLPLVPNTPLIQRIIQTQEVLWCVDSRASNWPNFVSQLRDVNDQYFERVGIRHRQVDFTDPSCQVKHTMPDNHGCSGCAAWVYYANSHVLIEYRYQVAYVDWRTTQGHELGHALLGLHEQYRDSGNNIACTGKQWTVMDCSSGVRYPQQWDVDNGCAAIGTTWCGQAPAPPPPSEWAACDPSWGGWWNSAIERWVAQGSSFFDPVTGAWASPPRC